MKYIIDLLNSHLSVKAPTSKKKKSKYKITAAPMEPLSFESSETQLEEIMLMASVNKIHGQVCHCLSTFLSRVHYSNTNPDTNTNLLLTLI